MELKMMTFNLRCRVEADGANCFDYRRDKILALIEREAPDVIGFQEATDGMLAWLHEVLKDYVVLGHGRDKNYFGECPPIAYRRDRFLLHGFREEWLSDHPQEPGSRLKDSDQSGCPRVYCCAELVERETGSLFAFFNTHFDHRGRMAQLFECDMLLERIGACGLPFVLTGDLNARPDSATIGKILSTRDTLGTVDATREITGTFHNFSMERIREGQMAKIDYIFTNLPTDPARSYAIPDDDACGHFYSDHNAVCAYVTLAQENDTENAG
ncbi:MAG: endonuclease/exonuclease/phosphatase family protein [Clostridia bacterium]|nr:endonuclease/exonuclease/phosphatase family protein [Clostridia bacterium]